MSVGGGKTKNSNKSSGSQAMESFISPDQLPYLRQLWGQASGDILGGNVGAANVGGGDQLMQGIMNNPFAQQLQAFSRPNNELVQKNISLLGQNLNQNLQNNLMPQIADQSIMGGGLGGGRQGVAQGLALQGTQQALSQGAQDIQNNAYNQALGASQFGANWATNNAMQGIMGFGNLQQQQLTPLLSLAQILGNPAILQKSSGKNSGSGSSSSWNASFGYS